MTDRYSVGELLTPRTEPKSEQVRHQGRAGPTVAPFLLLAAC